LEIVTDQNNKPVLDEQTFEKLLEAAYVLQEDNRQLRELEQNLEAQSELLREQERAHQPLVEETKAEEDLSPDADYTLTLAEIVEAQHQIEIRHLELDKALAVVAERVTRITNASGAAIGIVEEKNVVYRAGAGSAALPVGSTVPLRAALCQANIRTGQVIRAEDVHVEILFDPAPCLQRGILSVVAVPIYHDGNIVGALELYFGRIRGFAEQDIHTCQLMAGLVTEAISRDAEANLRKSITAERSQLVAAIETLKPDLAALAVDQPPGAISPPAARASAAPTGSSLCWNCGNSLLAAEQFCGKCGSSRAGEGVVSTMQSKLASAWRVQQSRLKSPAAEANGPLASKASWPATPLQEIRDVPNQAADRQPETFVAPQLEDDSLPAESYPFNGDEETESATASPSPKRNEVTVAHAVAIAHPRQEEMVWGSAANARGFLESLSGTDSPGALARFWRSRRGDFYLGLAIIFLVLVVRWGIWSDHSLQATGRGTTVSGSASRRRHVDPNADLSLFDKMLIGLGLAEAPDAPEPKGNPETQVWIDLQTALYYCPGSDLYGKTPKGKMSSQRDAQLDQFEPAYRKACE
jgi:GAF domain-containing protein